MDREGYISRDRAALPALSSRRDQFTADEWAARVELAALYQLVSHFRWTDTILNHISLRVPGEETFLINPFGYLYEEITASSLVKVDLDGTIIDDPTGLGINRAGFIIHGAIHAARHDLNCVLHTHTRAGVAVSIHDEGLLPLSQHAAMLLHRVAYHEFEGIAVRPDEQERIVANLGMRSVLILRNHGLLVAGRNAAETFSLINLLERACEIQVAALAGGAPARRISLESITATRDAMEASDDAPSPQWPAMMRLVQRIAPDFAT